MNNAVRLTVVVLFLVSKIICQNSDELKWHIFDVLLTDAEKEIVSMLPAITNNPYANAVAMVRQSNTLCDQENIFMAKRFAFIKQALIKQGFSVSNKVPRIAVVCSGGGYRAMLYTVGALQGLLEMQLLDTVSYVVGLSGSTWAIAPWISSGKSITEFNNWLVQNIDFNMSNFDEDDFEVIGQTLATKYWFGQPVGFADIYGSCIGNDLFDFFTINKELVYLSNQASVVDGSMPFPIYTAISGDDESYSFWYEFTPYEVGATWLSAYVPTWAFGRAFENGISVSNASEQNLGTLLGTFGLAIGVDLKDLFQNSSLSQSMKIPFVSKIVSSILASYGNERIITAQYFNFASHMPNTILQNKSVLQIVDGGLAFNLPYPPISGQRVERTADIIIFVDASSDSIVGQELQNVQTYALANHLPFPPIDYTNIGNHAVSIFTDPNRGVPTVIYIPRVVDQALLEHYKNDPNYLRLYALLNNLDINTCMDVGPCNTFNFIYTCDQAQQMAALGEFNMRMAQDAIVQAINSCL